MVGRTSDESQEWLNEAETHGDEAKDGVGVGVDGLGQVPQLQQDQDEARHGEAPGQHHEVSVPDEPLIKIETSLRCPRLFKISKTLKSLYFTHKYISSLIQFQISPRRMSPTLNITLHSKFKKHKS